MFNWFYNKVEKKTNLYLLIIDWKIKVDSHLFRFSSSCKQFNIYVNKVYLLINESAEKRIGDQVGKKQIKI